MSEPISYLRFETEVDVKKIPSSLEKFFRVVPREIVVRRVEELKSQMTRNPFDRLFIESNHDIELSFSELEKLIHSGKTIKLPQNESLTHFCSFIVVFTKIYPQLSPSARARLSGNVRSAFLGHRSLKPIYYEFRIATHLRRRGYEIGFHDLESGGGFDLMAKCIKTGWEMEVECKHLSPDIGRKVKRRDLHRLASTIIELVDVNCITRNQVIFIKIALDDRLTANHGHHMAIANAVVSAINGERCSRGLDYSVETSLHSTESTPFHGFDPEVDIVDKIRDFAERNGASEHAHIFCSWRPDGFMVMGAVESKQSDTVMPRIRKVLNGDVKRQFSKNRPGLLCVHFDDLSLSQLKDISRLAELGSYNGLQALATDLIGRRSFLCSVAFSVDGELSLRQLTTGQMRIMSSQEQGGSYVFHSSESIRANWPCADLFPMLK